MCYITVTFEQILNGGERTQKTAVASPVSSHIGLFHLSDSVAENKILNTAQIWSLLYYNKFRKSTGFEARET